ncbi:MAG: phosphoadenylyl-sulfate reductase [Anaerohalosphaera sp.]|nr:phosphoadenylyl-sulfate reductase [Anaerohalosphaera sp.]
MNDKIDSLISKTEKLDSFELLRFIVDEFGSKFALASSFSAEDMVITDMLCELKAANCIFTLDTGRLAQETYDVIEETRKKYGIEIEMLFPDSARLEDLTMTYGPNLFYSSVELRKLCCQVRKVEPLRRKLSQLDAWICGLRREQSVTRDQLKRIEWDEAFGLVKVNPLADWSGEQVWKHIRDNEVPYNKLHDKGYPSIGCSPCTRAVKEGGDIRSGRWWWESPEHKECGLHIHP